MKLTVFVFLSILLIASTSLSIDQKQPRQEKIQVSASDTEQIKKLLMRKKIEAMFRDGTYIKGQVKEVDDGQIVIDVKESEGTSALQKGEQTVAIESLSTVQMTNRKGPFRGILTGAGIGGGALLGIGIALHYGEKYGTDTPEGRAAGTAAIVLPIGAGVGGYFAGRAIDDEVTTTIVIQP
jgi:hypothetical protein